MKIKIEELRKVIREVLLEQARGSMYGMWSMDSIHQYWPGLYTRVPRAYGEIQDWLSDNDALPGYRQIKVGDKYYQPASVYDHVVNGRPLR